MILRIDPIFFHDFECTVCIYTKVLYMKEKEMGQRPFHDLFQCVKIYSKDPNSVASQAEQVGGWWDFMKILRYI